MLEVTLVFVIVISLRIEAQHNTTQHNTGLRPLAFNSSTGSALIHIQNTS